MGYYINQRDVHFRIKASNKAKALQAIHSLAGRTEEGGGGTWHSNGKIDPHFSFVNTNAFATADNLEDAFKAWRWDAGCDAKGDLCILFFNGQNAGDETILFEAIAPYVERDSYIEMQGEDGMIWRWAFDGYKVAMQTPTMEFS